MIDLKSILEQGVAAGRAPGFSAAVLTRDGARLTATAGARSVGDPSPVTDDTLFWIASCTKAITSVAALQLVERGVLSLDAPVGDMLPTLAAPRVLTGFNDAGEPILRPATAPITLHRLLTHTSGLGYDFACEGLAKYLSVTGERLMGVTDPDIPLMFEPGADWLYGIGIDWAGRLVEAASGQTLDSYFAEHIFAPLGMAETTFFPNADQQSRRATVHQKLPDGSFVAIPFGMPGEPHFMMGGGGLYSTAADYLKFLGAMVAGGAPLLKPETFAMMMANQVGDLGAGALKTTQPTLSRDFEPLPGVTKRWGLAGLLNTDPAPSGRSAGSLAWAGLPNCYYWADPVTAAAGIVLAQLFPFGDPGVLATFEAVERAVYV